jgi:choline dehydrogenase-like flavoprotein
MAILARAHRILNKAVTTEPLAGKIRRRIFPPEDLDVENEEVMRKYILNHFNHEFHVCGTAGLGRVVDSELRIMGMAGLRVVDASVFPIVPTSNPQSIVYAVAEKTADMIRNNGAYATHEDVGKV